jgi:hypothetical protein
LSPSTSQIRAIGLFACSALAVAALVARAVQLRSELKDETAHLAQQRSRTATSTLNRLSLPPARALAVCNDSSAELKVAVVTAVYLDPHGSLASQNSASEDWRSWTIPAGSKERFADAGLAQTTGWDGTAVFYAIDVASGDTQRMFSGTSGDLADGCIHITAERMRGGN